MRGMTSMSRARVARRIAAGAAFGGGGIGLVGAAVVGLVLAEVQLAKRQVGSGTHPHVPHADGRYGTAYASPARARTPLRLAMLGDSTAAGQGVHRAGQTPGALLASGLAAVAERPGGAAQRGACPAPSPTTWTARSRWSSPDCDRVPDVCVIMIGANDVTHRMPATRSVRHLAAAVRRLRTAGAEVVVGTCPDLGTVEPVYQPLRWLARRACRQLAAAQTIGAVEQGGRTVSLGDLLGPEFEANPRELFGPGPLPPVGGGLRDGGDGGAADGLRGARPVAGRGRSGRTPRAARASCRWPRRRRRRSRRPARRSRRRCRRGPAVPGPC